MYIYVCVYLLFNMYVRTHTDSHNNTNCCLHRWVQGSRHFLKYYEEGKTKSAQMKLDNNGYDPIFSFWEWKPTTLHDTLPTELQQSK
jgi:hypothetical protein